jgi:hypothetical protein
MMPSVAGVLGIERNPVRIYYQCGNGGCGRHLVVLDMTPL